MASQERKGTEKLKVFFTPSAESFTHSVDINLKLRSKLFGIRIIFEWSDPVLSGIQPWLDGE